MNQSNTRTGNVTVDETAWVKLGAYISALAGKDFKGMSRSMDRFKVTMPDDAPSSLYIALTGDGDADPDAITAANTIPAGEIREYPRVDLDKVWVKGLSDEVSFDWDGEPVQQ